MIIIFFPRFFLFLFCFICFVLVFFFTHISKQYQPSYSWNKPTVVWKCKLCVKHYIDILDAHIWLKDKEICCVVMVVYNYHLSKRGHLHLSVLLWYLYINFLQKNQGNLTHNLDRKNCSAQIVVYFLFPRWTHLYPCGAMQCTILSTFLNK